MHSMRIKRKPQ